MPDLTLTAFALLFTIWVLVCGGLALAGRRVPPGIVFLPHAGALAVVGMIAAYSTSQVPWDVRSLLVEARAELIASDAAAREALGPLLLPSLAVVIGTCALRGPLRGPRTTWPGIVAFGLAAVGLLGLSVGALLDGAPGAIGVLLLGLAPLGVLASVAVVRGHPDGPGPEAGVIAGVAFGHAVLAGTVGLIAWDRLDALGPFGWPADPAGWRAIGATLAWLAGLGMASAALTGCVTDRARLVGASAALATHLLWLPILLSGALGQMF